MSITGYRYQGDPMPHEKVNRNASLVRMHELRPDLSWAALGKMYGGITRQRAQQIYASAKKKEEMYGHR